MSAIPAVASDAPERRSEEPGTAPGAGWRGRARALVLRFGPAVWCYAVLKLLGFTVFMKLLSFSGEYLKKHPASAAAPTPGTWSPAGTAGGTSRSPSSATTRRWCPSPTACPASPSSRTRPRSSRSTRV
ncbi:hypothetical protein ACFQ0M_25340 [Kitasatospora aburaviensis]